MPCCECAKAIVQVGISGVIYKEDYVFKDKDGGQDIATKMFKYANIECVQFVSDEDGGMWI